MIEDIERGNGLLSHREIAARLGIGRARVFYLEHTALTKIRDAFADSGILSICDFNEVRSLKIAERTDSQVNETIVSSYADTHGWLKVSKIVSLNNGCTDAREIAQAYKLLKFRHRKLLRPPLLNTSNDALTIDYRIEATAAQIETELLVRCWPVQNQSRMVKHLTTLHATAIVESILDEDAEGEFDIPLLVCVIVSVTAHKGL